MNRNQQGMEIDVMRLANAVWKNIIAVILSAVIFAGSFFIYTYFFITPKYYASTLLYVNSSSISLGSTSYKISSSDLNISSYLVDTYVEILTSRETLLEIIDEAELDCSYQALKSMISVSEIEGTPMFRVGVTCSNPEQAELIANTIATVLPNRIMDIVVGTTVKIVDHAIVPSGRSSPSYTQNLEKGALVGAVLAIAVIVGLELLRSLNDDMIHSADDMKKLYPEIPVLAVIPDMRKSSGKEGYYSSYGYYTPATEKEKEKKRPVA